MLVSQNGTLRALCCVLGRSELLQGMGCLLLLSVSTARVVLHSPALQRSAMSEGLVFLCNKFV